MEQKDELCDCGRNHQLDAQALRQEMLDEDLLFDLADFFKLFGDSTRVKILYALSQSELCVGDIAELLSMSQSAISHQLRILKQSKLVKGRREGKTVLYSLADGHVTTILSQGIEHIVE
ncbi:MAG: metalloregulator ArsR/SmtB family transcription factor [Oscillospiraceae bacterium]|nr:metalloregulator ArsR/SmtB family transcription factor [Oscillospiraceae bacterium]